MSIVDLASESFGQSLAVTPIQMITAVAAATNGGNLVQPYLVSEILDQDGTVISKTQPNVKRQVISEEASQDILEAMEAMVDSSSVDIEGYRIAGKSGRPRSTTKKIPAVMSHPWSWWRRSKIRRLRCWL